MGNCSNSRKTPNNNIIDDFVKENTKHFDSSHNHEHAQAVYGNALRIIEEDKFIVDNDIIELAAKLHDVRDHKYKHSISEEKLADFIMQTTNNILKTSRILKIIDNISYSKEVKGKREKLQFPDDIYLDIISDADRLEAIGKIGIERCITYTKEIGGKIPEDVVKHCHEKLLRLYNDNFIKTKAGRRMAEPLHNEIVEYVKNN